MELVNIKNVFFCYSKKDEEGIMKICIKSQGKDLESEIDPRFGRCKYFIFYDTDTMQYEAVENQWKEA